MYAQYRYLPNATQANVLSDVVAILTGTTDPNTLSAGCDKVNTYVISTIPAGWTLADGVAGTNEKSLSAPLADDPTKLKYLNINTNNASYLLTKVYESWNSTTHVGTNLANTSDATSNAPALTLTAGGNLFISASARHCLIASGNSALTTFSVGSGIVEHTRNDPWNTVANGYPCSAYLPLGNFGGGSVPNYAIYSPRLYNASTGSDYTGTNAGMGVYAPTLSTGVYGGNSNVYYTSFTLGCPVTVNANSSKQSTHSLVPLGISRNGGFVALGGDISANCGIYATTPVGGWLDEVTVGTDTYVIWASTATTRFAIKKA